MRRVEHLTVGGEAGLDRVEQVDLRPGVQREARFVQEQDQVLVLLELEERRQERHEPLEAGGAAVETAAEVVAGILDAELEVTLDDLRVGAAVDFDLVFDTDSELQVVVLLPVLLDPAGQQAGRSLQLGVRLLEVPILQGLRHGPREPEKVGCGSQFLFGVGITQRGEDLIEVVAASQRRVGAEVEGARDALADKGLDCGRQIRRSAQLLGQALLRRGRVLRYRGRLTVCVGAGGNLVERRGDFGRGGWAADGLSLIRPMKFGQ